MKKVLLICAMMMIASTSAFAVPVTISFDGLWDWGTSYTYNAGTNTWEAGTVANPTNPYYGTDSQDLVNGVVTAGDGKEDSYGVTRVNQIYRDDNGAVLFDRTADSYELTVFFYGFDDVYISGTGSDTTLLSEGGRILIYKDYSKDFNATFPPDSATGRTAADQFTTVTNGELVLDLSAKVLQDPTSGAYYTLENSFNFGTYRGTGSVLLDVVGGSWADYFDTDSQVAGSDLAFDFSSFPAVNGQPGIIDSRGWLVKGTGNGAANLVPEPASMVMMGLGMLGLGFVRRKRA